MRKNTGGMTANLQFDPASGLGINEPGETMFCTGLCTLLFGDVMESELVTANPVTDHPDACGLFSMARAIVRGYASANHYAGGFFFTKATDDPDVFDMPMTGGMQLVHIGDRLWLQRSDSGSSMFCYETTDEKGNLVLEMEVTDSVKINPAGTIVYFGFVLLGLGCLVTLLIKLAAAIVRKVRGRGRATTAAERQITLQQAIQGVSGVILFLLISALGTPGYGSAVFSCIAAAVLGAVSLVNAVLLAGARSAAGGSSGKPLRSSISGPYLPFCTAWSSSGSSCTISYISDPQQE